MLPVLRGKAPVRLLGKLWGILYVANLAGTIFFAYLSATTALMLDLADQSAYQMMADRTVNHSSLAMFLSGVLAGWLMGLVSWLVAAARDTIGQIVIVWIIATVIGFMGLHHCIVGSSELAAACFAGVDLSLRQFFRFLLWVTLGNAVGGMVFVALIKFGHARIEADESRTTP